MAAGFAFIAAVGAVASLTCAKVACASASIRTNASLDVQEAAGVSVVSNTPLRLLLSNGVATSFSFAATQHDALPANALSGQGSPIFLANTSGLIGATTGTGEVLSVSMSDASSVKDGASQLGSTDAPLRFVIAQFN